MISRVSLAALISRSTAKTLAPSRANSTAVALPLLQPSAIAPAPATIATLSLRRPMRRHTSALRPFRFGGGAIDRIDRDGNAVLPLHDHERRADAMARGVELHLAGKCHRGRAGVEFRLMHHLGHLDLVGLADLFQRILEDPDVAVAVERVLGHPGFTGALLERIEDLLLALQAPVRHDEDVSFEQIRRDALEHLRRAVGAAAADHRNDALVDVKLVHLVEAEL